MARITSDRNIMRFPVVGTDRHSIVLTVTACDIKDFASQILKNHVMMHKGKITLLIQLMVDIYERCIY